MADIPFEFLSIIRVQLTSVNYNSRTAERIHALTEDRRHTIALLLEQMESMGITVVTRRMESYPRYLREKLGAAAPPYLYICGAGEIADAGGIGIVGSRNPSVEASDFARRGTQLYPGEQKG